MRLTPQTLSDPRCPRQLFVILAAFCLLLSGQIGLAQISEGGTPPSFTSAPSSAVPTVTMSPVDEQSLLAEDEALEASGVAHAFRFAFAHEVNLGLNNAGNWTTLPNGDRIWRLRVTSPGARSIHFMYDQWRLSKQARLWIYSDDHESLIGAFTTTNNWDGTNITSPTRGSAATLELLIPADETDIGELNISQVCHAYRPLFGRREADNLDSYGDACACQQDINCPVGAGWQDEKRAVAMIITGGTRWCSGTILNNTRGDFIPYFLSANHCLDGNQTNWMFIFNYESPTCGGVDGSLANSVSNATQVSTWGLAPGSDFVLLQLSTPPPISFTPYYAGWDRNAGAFTGDAAITHPAGDVKMIMTDAGTTVSDDWNNNGFADTHWRINTDVGASEGGSSGGSLMTNAGRVIGQVTGSPTTCCPPEDVYFGKFFRDWTGGGTSSSRVSDWLDPDGTGAMTTDGAYPTAPYYDLCTGYYIGFGVEALPFAHTSYTTYSTNNSGAICRPFPGPDNVYYWYSPCSTAVTISLCGGSTWDTGLYVRQDDCAAGTEVACNDDWCGLQSQLSFNTSPGHSYYIFVDGYSASSYGKYTLNVSGVEIGAVPGNDLCPGYSITGLPYNDVGNTCPANNNYPNCVGPTSSDVYYTLNLSSCQLVTISLCGSSYDTAIEVRTAGGCPGALQAACNDDYCGLQSQVSFVALAGENYYINIHGFSVWAGAYTMSVTGVPWEAPNDHCSGSIVIAGLPYSHSGSTLCATDDGPNCIEYSGVGPEVFYTYTAPGCENVTVSLCGTAYDSGIEVRAGASCPGDTYIACDDDGCGYPSSSVTFGAAEGVTYYFIVHGFYGAAGTYQLLVTSAAGAPPNDLCGGAGYLPLSSSTIGSTTCATNQEPNCWNTQASPEVYYYFYYPGGLPCDNVTVSLCGSSFDTALRVGTGGACPGTTQVGCDDDGLCGLQSSLVFAAVPGTYYYVTVGGYWATYTGVYRLSIQPSCDPDSLVIQRVGNDIFLDWAPLAVAGPYVNYKVYRSSDPSVPIVPLNLIATVSTPYYYDINRALDPALASYYAVTSDVTPSLMMPPPNPGETTSLAPSKFQDPAALEAARQLIIPAYIDPANLGGPNPNKPAELPQPVQRPW